MFVSLVNLMDYSTELTVQYHHKRGFPGGSVGKEPACNAGDTRDAGSIPGSGIPDPLEEAWKPIPVYLPGESHGQRNLEGYSR